MRDRDNNVQAQLYFFLFFATFNTFSFTGEEMIRQSHLHGFVHSSQFDCHSTTISNLKCNLR